MKKRATFGSMAWGVLVVLGTGGCSAAWLGSSDAGEMQPAPGVLGEASAAGVEATQAEASSQPDAEPRQVAAGESTGDAGAEATRTPTPAPESVPVPVRTAAAGGSVRARDTVVVQLKPGPQVYELGVAFAYATNIWFPVDCYSPSVGDPRNFGVVYDPRKPGNRRFVVTPIVDVPGSMTNVTFQCDEGIHVVLRVRQTAAEQAVDVVQFEIDPQELAFAHAAAQAERDKAEARLRTEMARVRRQALHDARVWRIRGMLRRYHTDDGAEYGRKDHLLVKAFRTVLEGREGCVLFQVKNHTGKDVTIASAEVVDEATRGNLQGVLLVMDERRVAKGASAFAGVLFEATGTIESVKLIVREDGPRVVEVSDIEM